jgi:methylamine dehydrogenase accessory protein MauD
MTTLGIAAAFWASYVLLWAVVALFGLLIVLMYRQFGLAFMRPRERAVMQGLDIGKRAPAFALTDQRGLDRHVGFKSAASDGPTVLVFALPTCDICARLARDLVNLPAETPQTRFVWIDGATERPARRAIYDVDGWIAGSAVGDAVHREWDVSAVPFCFVISPAGRILDKRLANRREDVELALGMRADLTMEASPST